ncbi:unnamed protein product [Blepharisma stoltei]|uniref:Uncharacterized protein n=1 Tax=Blepharisma stoltei TaxID=1481888 RepID=A0AAU9IWF3_9CILI|nr:unnamed protein product [Blepharisma stoltei]
MENTTFKVITLGNYGVGKTSLLLRAVDENPVISSNYMCTIGVDFKTKMHVLNGEPYKLMIWDTAGQEQFYHINRLYYSGCNGVILVYDITSFTSFEKINFFKDDFENYSDGKIPMVLVGNKCDCKDRQVTPEQGHDLAEKLEIPFLECSALTGIHINKVFDVLLQEIVKVASKEEPVSKTSFVINAIVKQPKKKIKQCCLSK